MLMSILKFIRDEYFRNRLIIDKKCTLLRTTSDSQMLNKQKTDWERNDNTGHGDALMSIVYGLRSVDRITDNRPKPNREDVWISPASNNSIEERLKQLSFK